MAVRLFDIVGSDSVSTRENAVREHMECSPTDSIQPSVETVGAIRESPAKRGGVFWKRNYQIENLSA